MALITKSIKGTQDILPSESHKVRFVEQTALEIAGNCGFREIRIPVFEHTELFQRGVGDTTDVVQKEMYTFLDKGERSITLRPEGTAGVVRAYLENGLYNEPMPQKLAILFPATAMKSRRREDCASSISLALNVSERLLPLRTQRSSALQTTFFLFSV